MSDSRQALHTHAFLRIEHDTADPQEVTSLLGISPTQASRRGDLSGNPPAPLPWNVWVLSSAGSVSSTDSSDHIEWLLAAIGTRASELESLRERGHRILLYCVWMGKGGYGGPRLSPGALRGLAQLGVEVWFDVGSIPRKNEPAT